MERQCSPRLDADTILAAVPACIVREQEDRYLVYNPATDEMHLVPRTGYFVLGLCDGTRPIHQIEAELSAKIAAEPRRVQPRLRAFLSRMIARGILAVSHA